MRWVLHTIADAANRDGDNARPGMRAIVEGSLYSEGSARRAIARLVEDGWLEVTERGGGHGHESVYRVIMDRPSEVSQDERQPEGHSRAVVAQKSLTQVSNNDGPVPLIALTDTDTVEDEPSTALIDDLNILLARRYSAFAGSPAVNHETQKWRTDMRLLLQRGPSSWAKPQEIESLAVERRINGIFDHLADRGTGGFCWAAQIRSPGALRKHWDQITVAAGAVKGSDPISAHRPEVSYDPDNADPMGMFA